MTAAMPARAHRAFHDALSQRCLSESAAVSCSDYIGITYHLFDVRVKITRSHAYTLSGGFPPMSQVLARLDVSDEPPSLREDFIYNGGLNGGERSSCQFQSSAEPISTLLLTPLTPLQPQTNRPRDQTSHFPCRYLIYSLLHPFVPTI
jgi:hypothetical protein